MQALSTNAAAQTRYGAINRNLFRLYVSLSLWTLFGAPLAARFLDGAWAYTALAAALLANGHWALLHEALHGNLSADKRVNRTWGRTLAILFGSSFRLLRFGHLSHHYFNRHPLDRPDAFDPAQTSKVAAYLRFMVHTLGGQYISEVVGPALFCLPARYRAALAERILAGDDPRLTAMRRQATIALSSADALREIRTDFLTVVAALATSALLWGKDWYFLLLVLAIRGFLVSFLDNLYHFRTPIDQPEFARNLRLPTHLGAYLLHTNLHQVHHRSMALPWWRLPAEFAAADRGYDGGFFTAALRQVLGPAPVSRLQS